MSAVSPEKGGGVLDGKQEVEPREASFDNGQTVISDDEIEKHEVFKKGVDGADFRTVTWQRAVIIFLKIQVATGVLSIPSALYSLGAVGGGLLVVGWQAMNTWTAILMADFRNLHPECHNISDLCGVMWGPIGREFTNAQFIITQVLCTGSGILGISIALNALSEHGACSVGFSMVGAVLICAFSCIRTFSKMTTLMYIAFGSIMTAVLIVVIGVTLTDRPAAAPQTGPYELGFYAIAMPTFAAGISASGNIFISSAAGPSYLPVISEMRRPHDYKKAAIIVGIIVGSIYLSLSMVIYAYCGAWVATPSLGSAGPVLKKAAYGVALPGLIVSGGIFNTTAAKSIFVRILRGSPHLQSNSFTHWATWLGVNITLCMLSFIIAEAIPIFNYILGVAASFCLGPMSLIYPACMWFHMHPQSWKGNTRQKCMFAFHVLVVLIGGLTTVGGTYGIAIEIKEAYASGAIGSAFSCADNSNTVASS